MGATSKTPTIGYRYYLGIHMILCHGPIDKLVSIEVDNKVAWSGESTGGVIVIDNEKLFGGDDREGGISGSVDLDMGGDAQTKNTYLQTQLGSDIPAYRGVVGAILKQVYIGMNPYLKKWAFWGERIHVRHNGTPQWYDSASAIGNDMNPAHILRECLTDPNWGLGYPETDIDDDSFIASADTLKTESMGISLLWDKSMSLEDFIKQILKHIDASIYVDRSSGKFVLKLVRDDYVVADLPLFDESSISKISNFKRNTVSELINSVTIVYWDGATGKKGSITVQDIALAAQQRATINTTKQFPGFTNGHIASRVGSRVLKALSTPTASATIYANRSASNLNIGDVFALSWERFGLTKTIMRVVNIELGTLDNNTIKISAIEDVFAISSAVYAAPPPSEWTEPNNPPAPCPYYSLIEAPYWEIVQRQGEAEAQTKAADSGFILASGVRPSNDAVNSQLWSSTTGTYVLSGSVDFCPTAIINANISYTDTVFSLASPIDIDSVGENTWGIINAEIVKIVEVSQTQITIERGCLDTVPQQHGSGSRIFFPDVYSESDGIEYVQGELVTVKILPTTSKGTLALSDVGTPPHLTIAGRLAKPYPPGALKLNGTYYADTIPGVQDLQINWRHRDRLQQTAALISSAYDHDIGPEANTTYTITLVTQSGTQIASNSGITGNEHIFTLATMGNNYGTLRVILSAQRDGLDSLQSHDYEFTRLT